MVNLHTAAEYEELTCGVEGCQSVLGIQQYVRGEESHNNYRADFLSILLNPAPTSDTIQIRCAVCGAVHWPEEEVEE